MARHDSRHRGPEESRDAKHTYRLTASTAKVDWPCYKNAMSDFQRKSSMENYRRKSTLKVARRNATKTPSKPLRRISTYHWGLGHRLHRSGQSGEVSTTKEQLSMMEIKSVKLKESVENAKPRPTGLKQIP